MFIAYSYHVFHVWAKEVDPEKGDTVYDVAEKVSVHVWNSGNWRSEHAMQQPEYTLSAGPLA